MAAGSPWPNAKEYLNAVRKPLLSLSRYPDETLLCDIYNVPGLHCKTGVTAKLIKEIERSFSGNEETGSHSFEGNHARKLLRIIGRMRHEVDHLESENANKERIEKIIGTLEAFDEVVVTCFSKQLIGDYKAAIAAFSEAYMELHEVYKVTVPVKAHLIMDHVVPQIERRHPGYGIGVVTEQAFESAHHSFSVEWEKTKINSISHPDYPQALLDCVVR